MSRVVWVVAGGGQLAAGQRPVVGVLAWLAAGLPVAVGLVGAHALRVAPEDTGAEAGTVLLAVAALGPGATGAVGLGLVSGAAAAGGEVGAAGDGANGEYATSGHG
ncbi:hypothetical protein [Kitasatospora sp. NPDC091276]|uniref:hypothetical protein n=1 Tax=unclassified Kitasatospora TaxID=2633591 RepID=UPI003434187D